MSIEDIAFLACRGGWPAATMMEGEIALDQAIDYYDSVVDYDIKRVDGVRRDSQRARRLLRSFARNIAGQVSYATYKADMASNDSDTLDEDTVADYIKALKKLYVVEDLKAWNPNLRSRAAIRTSDTRHLVDPSIATAALGIGPKDLINDLETFGLIFENMAVRDLRVYAEALSGKLYHYRDNTGLECDAVAEAFIHDGVDRCWRLCVHPAGWNSCCYHRLFEELKDFQESLYSLPLNIRKMYLL